MKIISNKTHVWFRVWSITLDWLPVLIHHKLCEVPLDKATRQNWDYIIMARNLDSDEIKSDLTDDQHKDFAVAQH